MYSLALASGRPSAITVRSAVATPHMFSTTAATLVHDGAEPGLVAAAQPGRADLDVQRGRVRDAVDPKRSVDLAGPCADAQAALDGRSARLPPAQGTAERLGPDPRLDVAAGVHDLELVDLEIVVLVVPAHDHVGGLGVVGQLGLEVLLGVRLAVRIDG